MREISFTLKRQADAVELVESAGEWFVRTIERGTSFHACFEAEDHAMMYAENQRERLGLRAVQRI